MGIIGFSTLFEQKSINLERVSLKFEKIYIDVFNLAFNFSYIYLDYRRRKRKIDEELLEPRVMGFAKAPTNEEFMRDFFSFIIEKLAHENVWLAKKVYFVFDNKFARKMAKWSTCLSRNFNKSSKLEFYPDIRFFIKLLEEFTMKREKDELPFLQVIEAPFDTDDLIFSKIKLDRTLNSNEVMIEDETIQKFSNIAIYSNDSDYICMFPFKEQVVIVDVSYERNIFIVKNFSLNEYNIERTKMAPFFKKETQKTPFEIARVLRLFGASGKNDYISTASFFDMDVYNKTLAEYRVAESSLIDVNLKNEYKFAVRYFVNYLKLNSTKKELYTNAARYFCFKNENEFRKIELIKNYKNFSEQNTYIEEIYSNMINFNPSRISAVERDFKKLLNTAKIEAINLSCLYVYYLTEKKQDNNTCKFFFISACSIYMMLTNVIRIFYCMDEFLADYLYFLANNVWFYIFKKQVLNQDINDYIQKYKEFINKFLSLFTKKK